MMTTEGVHQAEPVADDVVRNPRVSGTIVHGRVAHTAEGTYWHECPPKWWHDAYVAGVAILPRGHRMFWHPAEYRATITATAWALP